MPNPASGNSVTTWREVVFPIQDPSKICGILKDAHRTGSLTIDFGQGGISRMLWKEKVEAAQQDEPDMDPATSAPEAEPEKIIPPVPKRKLDKPKPSVPR